MVHSNDGLDTHKVFLHGPFECLFRRTKKIDSRFIQVAVFRHTQIFSGQFIQMFVYKVVPYGAYKIGNETGTTPRGVVIVTHSTFVFQFRLLDCLLNEASYL